MAITEADLTQEIFEQYGMTSFPPISAFAQLESEEPEILIWSPLDDVQIETKYYKKEIYFALSPDGTDWYVFKNNTWVPVTTSDFIRKEFTAAEIANIPQASLNSMFGDKQVYIKACLISNESGDAAKVSDIYVNSIQSYYTGSDYIYTGPELELNTKLWISIQSCDISVSLPENTELHLAFSVDGGTVWKTFRNGSWGSISLNNLNTQGMTYSDVQRIEELDWGLLLSERLRVAVGLTSENVAEPPKLYSIHFTHTEFEGTTYSNEIEVVTPSVVYNRCIISPDNYEYVEVPVEGIGFDDPDSIYNFYTTPNKIHLRVYNLGTLVGTRTSEIYKAIIVNTFDEKDFNVSLTIKTSDGTAATAYNTYCLLPDAPEDRYKTKGELSRRFTLGNPSSFDPEYPLRIYLPCAKTDRVGCRKEFYFRLTPTITTQGHTQVRIAATAVQV